MNVICEMRQAVIVLGGAFNPIHTQHVALLTLVKDQLETTGEWKILGGYFAVATDQYVKQKLSRRNEQTIRIQHRLALVREAIRDTPWLMESPFQNEMLTQHDGSAFALGQRLKRYWHDSNSIELIIVIGGDRMVKHGIPIWRKPTTQAQSSIIRVGIDRDLDLYRLWQEDLRENRIPNQDQFLIFQASVAPVSSTLVRSYLARWLSANDDRSTQEEIEETLVDQQQFVNRHVMNYIKTHHENLYS